MTPNFSLAELRCKCGCGAHRFHPGFLGALQALRDALGRPMTVTSAARCQRHNAAVGGAIGSYHICDVALGRGQQGALAVDIATPDGTYRGELFALAWASGWTVGWNARRGFLHLDRRDMVDAAQTSFDY